MGSIRKARVKDVVEIVNIWHHFMDEHREMGREWKEDRIPEIKDNVDELLHDYFSRSVRSKNSYLLVLEDEGKVQGFMLSMIHKNIPIFKKHPVGLISSLHVEKQLRGKGFSSEMFERTMKWFDEKGVSQISIRVMSCNEHAYGIYRKWGFKDIHVEMRLDID
jgi:ribosomal protein S18 acetylase RimI-like enzyme